MFRARGQRVFRLCDIDEITPNDDVFLFGMSPRQAARKGFTRYSGALDSDHAVVRVIEVTGLRKTYQYTIWKREGVFNFVHDMVFPRKQCVSGSLSFPTARTDSPLRGTA